MPSIPDNTGGVKKGVSPAALSSSSTYSMSSTNLCRGSKQQTEVIGSVAFPPVIEVHVNNEQTEVIGSVAFPPVIEVHVNNEQTEVSALHMY